jgi:hypothetical protein
MRFKLALKPTAIQLRIITNMPYLTRGQTHYGGVQNEKDLVSLLNRHSTMNLNTCVQEKAQCFQAPIWRHLGGTTQKADCDVTVGTQCFQVSIKNHENTGTFDWINTSKLTDFNPALGASIKTAIDQFKLVNHGKDVTPSLRSEVANLFNAEFDKISSDQIKNLLWTLYAKYPEYVLINHKKDNKLVMYPKEDNFPEFVAHRDWEYYFKTSKAKTSRMLFRRKDDQEVNTHLRMRLVLNNGVGALLGKSDTNKCSVPCLKIQQDKVNTLLSGLVNTVVDDVFQYHHKNTKKSGLDILAEVCCNAQPMAEPRTQPMAETAM